MERTQIELSNTILDNVFNFIIHRLRSGEGQSLTRTVERSNYPAGVVRKVTYYNTLQKPHQNGDRLIVQEQYCILVFPGRADPTAEEVITLKRFDGLVFIGLQLQTNTVLLELEYSDHWQGLVDKILSELREKFSDNRTETPTIAEQIAVPAKEPQGPIAKSEYSFDLGNEIVKIIYGLERGDFKRTKGLEYLHCLLFTPNQDIKPSQLVIGLDAIANSPKMGDLDELHESRDKQEMTDEPTKKETNQRLLGIWDEIMEIDEIKKIGDTEKLDDRKQKLLEEAQTIKDYLASASGKGGKSRAFPDENENARLSVRAAIVRSIEQIGKEMPNFADHLGHYIQKGYICRYSPPEGIKWKGGI